VAWDMAHEVVGAAALPSFFVYVSGVSMRLYRICIRVHDSQKTLNRDVDVLNGISSVSTTKLWVLYDTFYSSSLQLPSTRAVRSVNTDLLSLRSLHNYINPKLLLLF
jgi:hypothetical protein